MHIHKHNTLTHTHHWPVIWPYTGMRATHCLSWELISWHSVLRLCVLHRPTKDGQTKILSRTMFENGWDGGRAMMKGWERKEEGGRARNVIENRHRGMKEWGTQGRRRMRWSVLSHCLGFKLFGTRLFPSRKPLFPESKTPETTAGSEPSWDGWTVTADCTTDAVFRNTYKLYKLSFYESWTPPSDM